MHWLHFKTKTFQKSHYACKANRVADIELRSGLILHRTLKTLLRPHPSFFQLSAGLAIRLNSRTVMRANLKMAYYSAATGRAHTARPNY